MTARIVVLAIGMAAGVTFLACSIDSPTNPIDSQFAKGGNKGKPGGGVKPELKEYWIIPDGSGGNLIHVAGTGDVDSVNANVVFDYFFNGIRDDNYPSDDHYEYQYGAPLPYPVEQTTDGWHADIPWNGGREVDYPPYSTASQYRDALVTNLYGTGADPYAFSLRYVKGPNVVGGSQPQGVVLDGVETGMATADAVASQYHADQDVTSYAKYNGDDPDGTVWIAAIDITTPTCENTQYREGKGKNAVWIQTRTVTADFSIQLGYTQPAPPLDENLNYTWMEVHFVDVDGEVISKRNVVSPYEPGGLITGTISLALPDGPPSFNVSFAVDYVYPSGPLKDYAYDPGSNEEVGFTTTAGFGGGQWFVQTEADVSQGHFPVAMTPAVAVSCGG